MGEEVIARYVSLRIAWEHLWKPPVDTEIDTQLPHIALSDLDSFRSQDFRVMRGSVRMTPYIISC